MFIIREHVKVVIFVYLPEIYEYEAYIINQNGCYFKHIGEVTMIKSMAQEDFSQRTTTPMSMTTMMTHDGQYSLLHRVFSLHAK